MTLRPSTCLVSVPKACFVPESGQRWWEGCLRDAAETPVLRCGHKHRTPEEAQPCAAELIRQEYGDGVE